MIIKKKIAVLALVAVFICVGIYLNWNYANTGKNLDSVIDTNTLVKKDDPAAEEKKTSGKNVEEKAAKDSDEYFSNARIARQQTKDKAMTEMKANMNQEGITQQQKDKMADQLSNLSMQSVQEIKIETLVKAKGFDDAVAVISDDSVTIIVKAPKDGMLPSDTAKIRDIAMSILKLPANKIKIVEIK